MHFYFAAKISEEDANRLGCEPGLHAVITPSKERRDSVRKSLSKDIGENFRIGEIESSSFIAGESDNMSDIESVFYSLSELQIEISEDFADGTGDFDDSDDDDDDDGGIFSSGDDDDDGDDGDEADADEDEEDADEDEDEEVEDGDDEVEEEDDLDIDDDAPPAKAKFTLSSGEATDVKKFLASLSAKTTKTKKKALTRKKA